MPEPYCIPKGNASDVGTDGQYEEEVEGFKQKQKVQMEEESPKQPQGNKVL